MKKFFALVLALCMISALCAIPASAEADLSGLSVTCVCPFAAGGGTDRVMRFLADGAKGEFKNIVVENREGANGDVGMLYGATAADDGSVITMVTAELVIHQALGMNDTLTYDMYKPIMLANTACSAITVNAADDRFETLDDFIEYSKSNDVFVGNSGNGSIWQLAAAGLAQIAGTQFTHVPYPEGAAGAITDLLGMHIDAVAVSYAEVAQYVEAGQLKVLAVLANERQEACPDIPTAIELGYEGAALGTWRGLAVPASTPDDVVAELQRIFSDVCASDEFKANMALNGDVIDVLVGDDFAKMLEEQTALFTDLGKSLGLAQ